jgi:hypothetical protein
MVFILLNVFIFLEQFWFSWNSFYSPGIFSFSWYSFYSPGVVFILLE